MKKRYWMAPLLMAAGLAAFWSIFTIPTQPELVTIGRNQQGEPLLCYQHPQPQALDRDGQLNLLVWNIYKQNRANWSTQLTELSRGQQLLLLQEAYMTQAFKEWINQLGWDGTQARAFEAFGEAAGVINLAKVMPTMACAYTQLEPWLRLPKSAIYARYRLSDGQELAVVNLHAVNFTYGTQEYQQQLTALLDELRDFTGPVIVAGDFNSWSEARMALLSTQLASVGLQEVRFSPDNRTTFINGLPLDHVFYRGLQLEKAEAPISDASDHNPLLVRFRLLN
ncbi:TPA: endonuclease/exonuclease/phosphatase family protein [Vibrio cholerae]